MAIYVDIICNGFLNPLTGEYQKGQGHERVRKVRTQDAFQVHRCKECQKAYEWYRWQNNLKNGGSWYQKRWNGPRYIDTTKGWEE